jgi:transmembrane sensor
MKENSTQQDLLNILKRYHEGEANAAEKAFVDHYYGFFDQLNADVPEFTPAERADLEGEMESWLLNHINGQVLPAAGGQMNRNKLWLRIAVAASLILATAWGIFYAAKYHHHDQVNQVAAVKDVVAGSDKAVLILSDGKRIRLEGAENGELAKQAGIEITKTRDGQLVYKGTGQKTVNSPMVYNTIVIPKGGQHQLILPDGTRVWLNASSSLKYPVYFAEKERVVQLTGEGYFEVAKNTAKPFKVLSAGQLVEVYGTHFNISAYADEQFCRTTLLEGSVRVSKQSKKSGSSQHGILLPGQQAVVNEEQFQLKEVDVNSVIDWKNGYFIFKEDDIYTIMRKLSRWYNIDIDYAGNLEDVNFSGKVSKSKNLSEILRVLSLTGDVRFKVMGRRVTVMQ